MTNYRILICAIGHQGGYFDTGYDCSVRSVQDWPKAIDRYLKMIKNTGGRDVNYIEHTYVVNGVKYHAIASERKVTEKV